MGRAKGAGGHCFQFLIYFLNMSIFEVVIILKDNLLSHNTMSQHGKFSQKTSWRHTVEFLVS